MLRIDGKVGQPYFGWNEWASLERTTSRNGNEVVHGTHVKRIQREDTTRNARFQKEEEQEGWQKIFKRFFDNLNLKPQTRFFVGGINIKIPSGALYISID